MNVSQTEQDVPTSSFFSKRYFFILKTLPLSDIIKLGIPLLEINCFRAQMNDDAVRLHTTSG